MSTTDPGIEDGIKQAADDVENTEQPQEDLTSPSKWWFASTVNPLLAATFGPIANGFSICALVYSWRSYVPLGDSPSEGIRLPDPKWLIAINAVSLACAIIGNVALLLNMAQRMPFRIAQPITIIGFFTAGLLLIGDMAGLASSSTYYITEPKAIPPANHALTSAFYYAIFAAAIYIIVGGLMCLTVYGAHVGHYRKAFDLTASQRTLMLQTMSFVAYELLGALVFSSIEDWKYLDGVYWAQVTLLTVGLGDFAPTKKISRGLLFPYAIGGILMVGLVVGSIRTLLLERGKEKIAARITEKRREAAVHNVDVRSQTIQIGWFARADFSTDPSLSPAQRRQEEFYVMRKVQEMAERQRRYIALGMSLFFALLLWFVGAAVFMVCEREQGWTYFQALYFTFTSLLTIGYGDLMPISNSGKATFVFWSMLAVPSLTILISNMGDTIVKWFADFTNWIGSITVLPEGGGRETTKHLIKRIGGRSGFTPPGILGESDARHPTMDGEKHYTLILDKLAERLEQHLEQEELSEALKADAEGDTLERDIHFYHYVLARELQSVQKDANNSPPKKYSWGEWEYYLKLMGNEVEDEDPQSPSSGQHEPNYLVPAALQQTHDAGTSKEHHSIKPTTDGVEGRDTKKKKKAWLDGWSWLSDESPLMSNGTEAEWIIERLSAALVTELHQQRKGDVRKRPPISMKHAARPPSQGNSGESPGRS